MAVRRITAVVAAALVICAPSVASGDDVVNELPRPHVELTSGDAVVVTMGGVKFRLPAGSHIMTPLAYVELDVEMRRLQEQETRLVAENESLRETAAEWQPGWRLLLGTAVVALAGGIYLGAKF